jgi:hypothetical protein
MKTPNHLPGHLRPALTVVIPLAILGLLSAAKLDKPGPSHPRIVLSKGVYAEGVCFGDVDGDGTRDLVAGPFYYPGPAFGEQKRFRPGEASPPVGYGHKCFQSWIHDVNGDDRADILQVTHHGRFGLLLYLQPEGPSESWPVHTVIANFGNESPEFVDVTGDGQPELVAMDEGRFGFYTINGDDPAKPWPFHAISPKRKPYPYFHGLGIGDLNGDGRSDIVEKDGWFEAPENPLADEWTYHEHQFSAPGGAQMLIYDIDGDGDNDIVTSLAAHGWGLAWFENTPGEDGIALKKHELMPTEDKPGVGGISFSQHHALEKGDFNGDGLTDFVTGKRYWAHNGRDPGAKGPAVIYWFELRRSGAGEVEFIPHLLDNDSGVGTQVAVADVNGDGLSDIGVGNKKGVFSFLSRR